MKPVFFNFIQLHWHLAFSTMAQENDEDIVTVIWRLLDVGDLKNEVQVASRRDPQTSSGPQL